MAYERVAHDAQSGYPGGVWSALKYMGADIFNRMIMVQNLSPDDGVV